ncbi:type IV toxin-antitoxin system AbiEi family antitoxin domain-containing protein [Nocardioides sp. SYSU D00065]|uniref:type IV toxin-antitoxin system AbiEi family antitoxin domain-containing protein n=1 Tax=Nocardioides sp. SYSU D00065 TaxID=2817378 RepID=UPI001B317C62|nr:type IV toxin-antitoxin system AbiEi family antitoxin domain-containing protein [Nocardioides sp. SYSU D00065]
MPLMPPWCRDVVLLDARAPVPIDRPFTARDADACGVPAALRHKLVARGLLRPLVRGVYVASQVPDSFRLRVAAVALVTPPHVVVVDRTAAWIHGVDALPRTAIRAMPALDLYSRDGSRVRRAGVASGIRELRPRDVEQLGPLAVTTALRTACDLGRLLWRYDALAAVDGFLRHGVDRDELVHEVERFKGFRGVVQLRHLAAISDAGAESPPESALRLHWHESGIPAWPETQVWVHGDDGAPRYRIDVGDREVRFGAEYYGEEFHTEADRVADERRLAWLSRERCWHMEVFMREDVYGAELAAGHRLRHGYEQARASLGMRQTTYVDLAR